MLAVAIKALDDLAWKMGFVSEAFMITGKAEGILRSMRLTRLRIIRRWPLVVSHYRSAN